MVKADARGETFNDRDGPVEGMLRLPVAKLHLLNERKTFKIAVAVRDGLHERVLLCLRPGRRIGGKHQQLALGEEGCEGMQELHPGGQNRRVRQQQCVHRCRRSKRYW